MQDVIGLAKKIAPELDIDVADMDAAPVVRLLEGKTAITQVTARRFGGRDFAIMAMYALQGCVAGGMQRHELKLAKVRILAVYKDAGIGHAD